MEGTKKLVFLRHSETKKIAARPLSIEGQILAYNLQDRFIIQGIDFQNVFAASADRTIQTASIVSGKQMVYLFTELDIPEENMGLVLGLYAQHGDAPLQKYIDEGKNIEKLLYDYGGRAWKAIQARMYNGNVLVVGHGVLINAVVAAASEYRFPQVVNMTAVQECHGFVVYLSGKIPVRVEKI